MRNRSHLLWVVGKWGSCALKCLHDSTVRGTHGKANGAPYQAAGELRKTRRLSTARAKESCWHSNKFPREVFERETFLTQLTFLSRERILHQET